jgi:hypothetical protein
MQGSCQLAATTAPRASVLRWLDLRAEWVGESPSGGDYSPMRGGRGGNVANGLGVRIVGAVIA